MEEQQITIEDLMRIVHLVRTGMIDYVLFKGEENDGGIFLSKEVIERLEQRNKRKYEDLTPENLAWYDSIVNHILSDLNIIQTQHLANEAKD